MPISRDRTRKPGPPFRAVALLTSGSRLSPGMRPLLTLLSVKAAAFCRRDTSFGRQRQLGGAVGGGERVDDLVERFARHHLVDLVERQVDAVVGDATLREIVGADALGAVAAADLALPIGGARRGERLTLHLIEPGTQHLQGARPVLVLRLLVLL